MATTMKKKDTNIKTGSGPITASLIYMNDAVRLCSEACACCWDKTLPESYEEKVAYLGRRAKTGHLSIMEHSNLITLLKLPVDIEHQQIIDIIDMLTAGHYLNIRASTGSDGKTYIVIGGSLRGYVEMINLSNDYQNNDVIRAICGVLYQNYQAPLFYTLINDGKMVEESFTGVEPDPKSMYFNPIPEETIYEDEKIKVLSIDNKDQIKYNLFTEIGENIFNDFDISRIGSVSILFKNMSRTGTHQLVRHRNGMTQESQRYVDYSNAAFADPVSFKPDRYDTNHLYSFDFGGHNFTMTSNEIGEAEIAIYHQLLEQGMMKEDARSFLPGNVKCRKLYMTFCFAHFEKFIELRSHKGAQAEIRTFGTSCKEFYENYCSEHFTGSNYNNAQVDVIISDKEVIMQNIIDNEPELNGKEETNG